MYEIPNFGLRAYALFYSKYGLRESFTQLELAWNVSTSMRKKIFATLLNAGWLKKTSRTNYKCVNPDKIFKELLEFKVPKIMRESIKPYSFTGLSAIEVWSDFSYVQRSKERSPYFIKVLQKDLQYWKHFFNEKNISNYVDRGSNIGEFIILIPVKKIIRVKKEDFYVDKLNETIKYAKNNEMFQYAYNYMRKKYEV